MIVEEIKYKLQDLMDNFCHECLAEPESDVCENCEWLSAVNIASKAVATVEAQSELKGKNNDR